MEIIMLTEEGENPAKIQINEDIVLILDANEEDFKMDAEYPEEKYTQEEIQELANEFIAGLMNSIKEGVLDEN